MGLTLYGGKWKLSHLSSYFTITWDRILSYSFDHMVHDAFMYVTRLSNLKRSFSFTGSLINWFYLMIAVILHEPIFFSMWNFSQSYFPYNDNSQYICLRSLIKGEELCRPSCRYGYFSLYGMQYCHAWLTCNSIQSIQRHGRIGGGLVKEVLLTTSIIKNLKYRYVFLNMQKIF